MEKGWRFVCIRVYLFAVQLACADFPLDAFNADQIIGPVRLHGMTYTIAFSWYRRTATKIYGGCGH